MTVSRDELKRLGQMDAVATSFEKVGEEVYGTVVNRTDRTDEFDNGTVVSAVTEIDTGEPTLTTVNWFGVLATHAEQHDPQPGDLVYIRRLKDVERKPENVKPHQDRTYRNFRVMVHKKLGE